MIPLIKNTQGDFHTVDHSTYKVVELGCNQIKHNQD